MCGDDVQLISCSGCYLYVLTSLRHATVAGCTDCQIVLGAVSGACDTVCGRRAGLAWLCPASSYASPVYCFWMC